MLFVCQGVRGSYDDDSTNKFKCRVSRVFGIWYSLFGYSVFGVDIVDKLCNRYGRYAGTFIAMGHSRY